MTQSQTQKSANGHSTKKYQSDISIQEMYIQKGSKLKLERNSDGKTVTWQEKQCEFEIQTSTKNDKSGFKTFINFSVDLAPFLNEATKNKDMTVHKSFKVDKTMQLLENNKAGVKIWIDIKMGDDVITANRGSIEFNK